MSNPPITKHPKELLVFELGGGGCSKDRRLRTVPLLVDGEICKNSPLSSKVDGEICKNSLYIDGIIYLLHIINSAILAFDVDSEMVTIIKLPGKHKPHKLPSDPQEMNRSYYRRFHAEDSEEDNDLSRPKSRLMELSGCPCVETGDGQGRTLWLLTEDHRWELRCSLAGDPRCIVAGVWDCGGVLAMYSHNSGGGKNRLCMTNTTTTHNGFDGGLPYAMTPEWPDYAFCWGYKPTLVSPASILGELSCKDEERRKELEANVMEALKPLHEHEKRKGQEATLTTVCFMEFLVRVMQQLPHNMEGVTKMSIFR